MYLPTYIYLHTCKQGKAVILGLYTGLLLYEKAAHHSAITNLRSFVYPDGNLGIKYVEITFSGKD